MGFTRIIKLVILITILQYGLIIPVMADENVSAEFIVNYALPFDFTQYSQFAPKSYATDQFLSAVSAGLYSISTDHDRYYVPELGSQFPEVSDNGTVYTVSLKQNLNFSDGSPLTADDVVFTYRSLLSPAINKNNYEYYTKYFETNASISKVDDLRVKFEIKKSIGGNMKLLSAYIQPKSHFQARLDDEDYNWNADDLSDTISAGPFVVTKFDKSEMIIEMVRNQFYWNTINVVSDKIIFMKIEDKEIALKGVREDEIDILNSQNMFAKNEITNRTGIWEVLVPTQNHLEISLNHLHPYFGTGELLSVDNKIEGSKSIRKAMSHIIDRNYIVENISDGLAEVAVTIVPSSSFAWDKDLKYREYSLEEARNYMEMAGFNFTDLGAPNEDGTYTRSFFNITYLELDEGPKAQFWISELLPEFLKIGIGIEIISTDWNDIFSRVYNSSISPPLYTEGGYDILIMEYDWDIVINPYGLYESYNHIPLGSNIYNFINSEYDILSEKLSLAIDLDEKYKLMQELQDFYFEWEIVIPITHPLEIWIFNDELVGYDGALLAEGKAKWDNIGRSYPHGPPGGDEFYTIIIFGVILISLIIVLISDKRKFNRFRKDQ